MRTARIFDVPKLYARLARGVMLIALASAAASSQAQVSLRTVVELAQSNSSNVKLAQADLLKAESGLAASCKDQPIDKAMLSPNGAIQRRPRRPRPACCNSLMQTSALPGCGGAAPSRRVLVESTSNSSSRRCKQDFCCAPSSAPRRSASSNSTPFSSR